MAFIKKQRIAVDASPYFWYLHHLVVSLVKYTFLSRYNNDVPDYDVELILIYLLQIEFVPIHIP